MENGYLLPPDGFRLSSLGGRMKKEKVDLSQWVTLAVSKAREAHCTSEDAAIIMDEGAVPVLAAAGEARTEGKAVGKAAGKTVGKAAGKAVGRAAGKAAVEGKATGKRQESAATSAAAVAVVKRQRLTSTAGGVQARGGMEANSKPSARAEASQGMSIKMRSPQKKGASRRSSRLQTCSGQQKSIFDFFSKSTATTSVVAVNSGGDNQSAASDSDTDVEAIEMGFPAASAVTTTATGAAAAVAAVASAAACGTAAAAAASGIAAAVTTVVTIAAVATGGSNGSCALSAVATDSSHPTLSDQLLRSPIVLGRAMRLLLRLGVHWDTDTASKLSRVCQVLASVTDGVCYCKGYWCVLFLRAVRYLLL
jgi:hypothetical protein